MKSFKFTMIELLLVISIILVMLIIAIPVFGAAQRSVRKNQAQKGAFELKNAITKYQSDYQVLPYYTQILKDNNISVSSENKGNVLLDENQYSNIIRILRNYEVNGSSRYNLRKISYLDRDNNSDESNVNEYRCPLVAKYRSVNTDARYLVVFNLDANGISIDGQHVTSGEVLVIGFNPTDLNKDYKDMSNTKNWNINKLSEYWSDLKEKAVFSSEIN